MRIRYALGLMLLLLGGGGCGEKLAVNAACAEDDECDSGVCHRQLCVAAEPAQLALPCGGPGECASFACAEGLCVAGDQQEQQACRHHEECEGGHCGGDGLCDVWGDGGTIKVAGVQYGHGSADKVGSCADDNCAVTQLVTEAAAQGAKIIVTSEYALDQTKAEPSPEVGDLPATDDTWDDGSLQRTYSRLADELNVVLIIDLITQTGTGEEAKLYNTQVAFDHRGQVVARHYKFHLFGGEKAQYTPGDSFEHNFFDTPAGKMGLLICADIQCVVNGVGADCSAVEWQKLKEFTANKPDAVFFSAYWTVGEPSGAHEVWWPTNVQRKYAEQAKAWVIAANTTVGAGRGGGIFEPDGTVVEQTTSDVPSVIYGELPKK